MTKGRTMRRTRICTIVLAALAAMLTLPGMAQAWHASAQLNCPPGNTTVTAKFSYVFPSGGPWIAYQQILEVNPKTDQWTPVATQTPPASGFGNALTPNTLTVSQPLDGKPHSYVAKTWWDNGDEGHAKSPLTMCAPLSPVPGCDGRLYPPGVPLPVCPPPPPVVPPTVTPPAPSAPPAAPPTMPPPVEQCPYVAATGVKITRSGHKFTLRGKYLSAIRWYMNGRRVGKGRNMVVAHFHYQRLRATALLNGCQPVKAKRRVPMPIIPPPTGPPRVAG